MRFLLYNKLFIILVITCIDFCDGKKKKKEGENCPSGEFKLMYKPVGGTEMSGCITKECTKYNDDVKIEKISGGDEKACALFYASDNCDLGLAYKYTKKLDGKDLPECIRDIKSSKKCPGT